MSETTDTPDVPVISDEDLEDRVQVVQDLREQVAKARADREERELAASNSVTAGQLDDEEARLRAELTEELARADRASTGLPVTDVAASMAEAVAAQEAATAAQAAASAPPAVPAPVPPPPDYSVPEAPNDGSPAGQEN